jgi:hypothetical protein
MQTNGQKSKTKGNISIVADPIRCFYLDHGYDSQYSGPCCWQSMPNVRNRQEMLISPEYLEIKRSFAQGQWPENHCTRCRDIEHKNIGVENPVLSKRQSVQEQYDKPYVVADKLHTLAMDTGRLCNLQCRSCSAVLSSSWISESLEVPAELNMPVAVDIKVWPTADYDYEQDDYSELNHVNLIGGEPLYNPRAYGIIEKIYRETQGDCTLSFTTNAMIPLDFDRHPWLANFRQIDLMLSIDAVGPAAEFIRTGSRWETIERNVDFYQSRPEIFKFLLILPTHSALNLFELPDLHHWRKQRGLSLVGEVIHVSIPPHLSYQIFTDSEKQQLADFLNDNDCAYVIPELQRCSFDPALRDRFMIYMEHTKRFHGMDWREYLPKLHQLMHG